MATKQLQPKTDKEPRKGSNEDTLKKVLAMHKSWLDYRAKLLKAWDRDNKLYNNERVQKNYEGVADTFVPLSFGTIETMVSALATGDLSTNYQPQDIYKYLKDRFMPGYTGIVIDDDGNEIEESEEEYLVRAISEVFKGGVIEDEALDVLNALYDYYWESGDWDEELEHLIRSGLKIGNGAWWLTWEYGRPCLKTIPFPDFIFDPASVKDESCKFMGRRYLANLEDLRKEEIIDPITGKKKKRYSIPKVVKAKGKNTSNDKSDKDLKEELLFGSTVEHSSEDDEMTQVEVIEIMTNDEMYTVINRYILAEEAENPFKAQAKLRGIEYKGLIPGISWANYKDESLFIGKSEIATFWQEQERLNDNTNQKSDAVTRALLQQYRADPALKSQSKTMGVPGGVIWGTTNQYEAIPPATVPNSAFSEENSIKNNIREVTATDQIVKGVGSSEDITATEAKLQVAQSGQRIELKIKSLQRGPLKRLARLTLQMVQLFITDPFIVPGSVSKGMKPLIYTPDNYKQNFEPKISLVIDSENRKKVDQASATETYQMLIADPTNNLGEVKKVMLPKMVDLDKNEIQRISTPAQNPMTDQAEATL